MKKLITCLAVVLCFSSATYAQYYLNTYNPAGQNPGNLNNDPEQPLGNTPGYTTVMAASAAAPALAWSTSQSMPFAFDFNGSAVTDYIVSNSGVLTFTTSATFVPATTNAALPDASIPDKSVCVWGLVQGSGNDAIGSVTYGTAPNRQHWIKFLSFGSENGATDPANGFWTYWSIVLEETTNRIYIVDERTFNTSLSLTLGIQVDGSTAFQIGTAPNTPSSVTNGGNDSDPTDNVYYEYSPGTRAANDLRMNSIDLEAVESAPVSITGEVFNNGSAAVTSFDVSWSDDNGATKKTSTISANIPSRGTYKFTHPTAWNPTAGSTYEIQVNTSNPNGAADAFPADDQLSKSVFINLGIKVKRKALLEEFTTVPCQFCPDGAVVVEQVLADNKKVIAVGEHACFGTDAMTIPEASTYCTAFGSGAPTACVDRVLYDGEANVAISRAGDAWGLRSRERTNLGSAVHLAINGTYDAVLGAVSADVDVRFVDYATAGDIRVTIFVVEDNVVGSGTGYAQVNAYNTSAGHPYFGAGNPIANYNHRHVLRDVVPSTDAWGDNTVVPSTPVINTTYSKNYSFAVSSDWDDQEMSLVAFVSYFNTDVGQREVLNAIDVKLGSTFGTSTGLSTVQTSEENLNIYPNPSSDLTTIELNLVESNDVEVSVFDLTGKQLIYNDYGVMRQGSQIMQLDVNDLPNGFYFVNVRISNELITRKISVINE